jgi:hypothetical protein
LMDLTETSSQVRGPLVHLTLINILDMLEVKSVAKHKRCAEKTMRSSELGQMT